MSATIRRGTLVSFDSATWTALVMLDGSLSEVAMAVGEWVPAALLAADDQVAVLLFEDTNNEDGVILGPFGAASNLLAVTGTPANGQVPIGNGIGLTLATLTGTANRVTVTNGAGAITLSGPQDLHASATPTLGGLNLGSASGAATGDLALSGNISGANYVSGTWTPALTGSGTAGTFTYTVRTGEYTRVGNMVFVEGRIAISAIGTPPTGNVRISGLPFAVKSGRLYAVGLARPSTFNYTAGALDLTAWFAGGTTLIQIYESYDNAAASEAVPGNIVANLDITFSGWYRIS